ncbi:MAG: hypothetical protein HOM21_10335 [Halobacteriovoraceae bacterium]|nr:hypothetical protein [Halobacteriovoraceae bacterium]
MGLFDIFKFSDNNEQEKAVSSRLVHKLRQLLPNSSDSELLKNACIAGLLARVAYADMKIDPQEIIGMQKALTQWSELDPAQVEVVTTVAVEEMVELAGIENHRYCPSLNELMNNDQKYNLLKSLFNIAASDGSVESVEAEEIRLICQGLLLEHKHFISAQATVIEFLAALK